MPNLLIAYRESLPATFSGRKGGRKALGNPQAVHVKARAVVRAMGYNGAESIREYKDWHIEIRSGSAYVSVWASSGMVFLSMCNIPVFYRPGPWEQYLDLLFQRGKR